MIKKFILVSLLTTTMATQSPVAQAAPKKLLTLGAIKQSHAGQNPKQWSLASKIALGAGAITGATVVAIAAYCYAYGINPMDIASQSPEWLSGLYDYLREFASSTTTVTPTVTPCPSLSNGFPFENLSNHPFNFGTCSATSSVTPTVSPTPIISAAQSASQTLTNVFSQAANQTISTTPSVIPSVSSTISKAASETIKSSATALVSPTAAASTDLSNWCTNGTIIPSTDGGAFMCVPLPSPTVTPTLTTTVTSTATKTATSAASRFMDGLASGFSRYNPANWNLFN